MSQGAAHSSLVGGSTASRVINCPGSVALVAKMPPKPSSKYADEGTLLHDVMSDLLSSDKHVADFIGREYNGIKLTQDLIDDKIAPALEALNQIDPDMKMEIEVESRVGFGDLIPDAFGSTDVIGRLGKRTIVLDWKFGDGHMVSAEENYQLMFYAAAALSSGHWAFKNINREFIELIIIQPPYIRRWVTDRPRIRKFEQQLQEAIALSRSPEAMLSPGAHCKWCPAKVICPAMNGARDRLTKAQLDALPVEALTSILQDAEQVESVIETARKMALSILEKGGTVPGFKLVPKRATRSWVKEDEAKAAVLALGVKESDLMEFKSPAQVEKVLKTHKLKLPEGLTASVSSGDTIAPESDPRPAVLNLGKQLTQALSKLQ